MIFSTRSRIIARNDAPSTGIRWSRDAIVLWYRQFDDIVDNISAQKTDVIALALNRHAGEMPATGSGFDGIRR
jgi:hypothetical protein